MKHTYKGWRKPSDETPQPVGIVMGGNLRQNTSQATRSLQVPKPGEAAAHGIPTDPVLVISPVQRTPLTALTTAPPSPPKRR